MSTLKFIYPNYLRYEPERYYAPCKEANVICKTHSCISFVIRV